LSIAFCVVHTTLAITDTFVEVWNNVLPSKNVTIEHWVKQNSEHLNYLFFISNQITETAAGINEPDITPTEMTAGVCNVIFKFLTHMQTSFIELFVFLVVASMWLSVRGFSNSTREYVSNVNFANLEIKQVANNKFVSNFRNPKRFSSSVQVVGQDEAVNDSNSIDISNSFLKMRDAFSTCNGAVGSLVFLYIFKSVMHYTTALDRVLGSYGWIQKLSHIRTFIGFCITLGLAADITAEVICHGLISCASILCLISPID
jgi:hypothetical protein